MSGRFEAASAAAAEKNSTDLSRQLIVGPSASASRRLPVSGSGFPTSYPDLPRAA
jgi:hypothetical protein